MAFVEECRILVIPFTDGLGTVFNGVIARYRQAMTARRAAS